MLSVYPALGSLLAAFFKFIYPNKEATLENIENHLD